MTLKELMIASSGQDMHGMPKSSVAILNEIWYEDGTRETVDELALESPYMSFFAGEGFTQLDLDFGSKNNVELNLTCNLLERFRKAENSCGEDSDGIPMTLVVVFPEDYEGQYFIVCTNPLIHALTAANPDDDLTIIRMAFFEDNVDMYENEEYQPDVDDAEDE